MQPDHDIVAPPASDDPRTHARDAVEAMQAMGEAKPDVERALIGGAARHARFLERHGLLRCGAEPEAI